MYQFAQIEGLIIIFLLVQQLVFSFKCTESELLEKALHISVYTRVGVLRHKDEVGTYKMSLRTIYKEPRHLVCYKWMVLTNSSNSAQVKVRRL